MSTITPHYRTIKQLLQSRSFGIDEYQREYKWETGNIEELLNDLLNAFTTYYRDEHDTQAVAGYGDYFLGSIIVTKRNGKHYLVDGQQRVTSLTLLLIYLHRAAKERGLDVAGTLAPLIYSDSYGKRSYNLAIPERQPIIAALFKGEPYAVDGKDESVKNMAARYADIEGSGLADELDTALPHFAYWLMDKVGLIEIETDNNNYAYTIFETMNDRGKPLSPVDMLKAYLLAPISDEEQRNIVNETWRKEVLALITWNNKHVADRDAAFIKSWLRAQYAQSIRDRRKGATDEDWELIGSNFHRWVRDNEQRLGLGSAAQNARMITEEFTFFSKAYRQMLDAIETYTPGLEAVYYNGHNDFTWQRTVLLAPLIPTDDADTVRRKLSAVATYLDIWIMRRVVNYTRVSYSSTSYTMYLLCNEIRRKPLLELVPLLVNKLKEDEVTFAGYPSRGRIGITDLRLNQFSRRYITHLLARLTAYVEVQSGRPDLFAQYMDRKSKNAVDIEHLWPNRFADFADQFKDNEAFQQWRDHVAGLVLLPADVNRSLQDKPFVDKVPHYAKQNLYAASLSESVYTHQPQFKAFRAKSGLPFKPYADFSKDEQSERRKLVQQLAEQVWSVDRLELLLPR